MYGGWQVECTSVREVDSDVSRRDLLVTPPSSAGAPLSSNAVIWYISHSFCPA